MKVKKKTILDILYEKISKPFTISDNKNTLNLKKYITEKLSVIDESVKERTEKFRSFIGYDSEKTYSRERVMSISDFYEVVVS